MAIDETEVQTRHQNKLEELRAKNAGSTNRGSTEATERGIQSAYGQNQGADYGATERDSGNSNESGTVGRLNTGIRSSNESVEYAAQGTHTDYGSSGVESNLTPEEERERQLELQRQRQARYAEKKKHEKLLANADDLSSERQPSRQQSLTASADGNTDVRADADVFADGSAKFQLKNPFKSDKKTADVKLFTNKEIDEQIERLSTIYSQGSGLLDDLLEIIVKGHEKVSIWQLDDDEAHMLASLHLEKAKTDQGAARSARTLLSLYDRLYIWLLVGPRALATKNHIAEQGGLSFK